MYKIVKCGRKVKKIEKTLNHYSAQGFKYVDLFFGKGIIFACCYIVFTLD